MIERAPTSTSRMRQGSVVDLVRLHNRGTVRGPRYAQLLPCFAKLVAQSSLHGSQNHFVGIASCGFARFIVFQVRREFADARYRGVRRRQWGFQNHSSSDRVHSRHQSRARRGVRQKRNVSGKNSRGCFVYHIARAEPQENAH